MEMLRHWVTLLGDYLYLFIDLWVRGGREPQCTELKREDGRIRAVSC